MALPKITGTETEFGLSVFKEGGHDLYFLSLAGDLLVDLCAYRSPSLPFGALSEERYAELGRRKRAPEKGEVEEHRYTSCGIFTPGGRLYRDIGEHPESSTAECGSAREVALQEWQFDILWDSLRGLLKERLDRSRENSDFEFDPRLFKENSDGWGNSYGYHLNTCFPASFPLNKLIYNYLPFLVVQPILFGAGKFWRERARAKDYLVAPSLRREYCGFELSQRADFFVYDVGGATVDRRSVFNTKDEPHADGRLYSRLHQIVFDVNRSLIATYLKVGFNQLVLAMIEDHFWDRDLSFISPDALKNCPSLWSLQAKGGDTLPFSKSAAALRDVSGDLTFQQKLTLWDNRITTGLDILAEYAAAARDYVEQTSAPAVPDAEEIVNIVGSQVDFLLTARKKYGNDQTGFLGVLTGKESPLIRVTDWALKLKIVHHRLTNSFGNSRTTSWDKILGAEQLTAEEIEYIRGFQLGYGRVSVNNPSRKYWVGFAQEAGLLPAEENGPDQESYPKSSRNYLRWELVKRLGRKAVALDWLAIYLDDKRIICFPHPHRGARQDIDVQQALAEETEPEKLLKRLEALDVIRVRPAYEIRRNFEGESILDDGSMTSRALLQLYRRFIRRGL